MARLQTLLIHTSVAICLLTGCHSSKQAQTTVAYPSTEAVQNLAQVVNPANEAPKAAPVAPRTYTHSERMIIRLDSLMNDPFLQTTQMGCYVYDLTDNRPLYDKGMHQRMRPASTMKVVTAVTALAQLGENYNYSTPMYVNGKVKGNKLSGDLYIRGGFDTSIGSKELNAFVAALTKRGIKRIQGNLILDLSMKDDLEAGWGWCWDDKNPSLSPLLYNGKDSFGTNFLKALRNRGITISSKIKQGRVPSTAELLYNHQTPIADILGPMMKDSDNQYAESMFYQIAAQGNKTYASNKDAARYVKQFINEALQLDADTYTIADGSGLSLYDYITPELLVHYLKYAYAHKKIYDTLLLSLPIAGIDGTLEKRLIGTKAYQNVYAKTGTVTGICSLAGYATAANGHRLCFAIINQGQKRSSEARVFQDKVCKIMTE